MSLLLIDAEADRGDGMLAAAAAHHLHAALLLGAEQVSWADRARAAGGGDAAGRAAASGCRYRCPAVIVLAAATDAGPRVAGARRPTTDDVQSAIHGLEALSLQARDLIEPAPPSTARPGQTRPTPVKDLSRLLRD